MSLCDLKLKGGHRFVGMGGKTLESNSISLFYAWLIEKQTIHAWPYFVQMEICYLGLCGSEMSFVEALKKLDHDRWTPVSMTGSLKDT